jgi:hypothetical protein
MAIEAGISKSKKMNVLIFAGVLVLFAGWCIYDGYFNKKWIEDHKDAEGNPEAYLVLNRNAPPYLLAGAAALGVYWFLLGKKKLTADEKHLIFSEKKKISYDSIEQVDKTYFESKGYFVITYKNEQGNDVKFKISDKTYDNLTAVLERITEEIS